jgi:Leucine-rich repeat (LRR) protein
MNLVLSTVSLVGALLIEHTLVSLDLRSLNLSYNQLTQLPDSFGDLINLEEFYCNANRLALFPCLNQCGRLKVNQTISYRHASLTLPVSRKFIWPIT